jgi:hypothetical protein
MTTTKIGTLNEKSLHAELKNYISKDGDQFEVEVDGYVIDIVRGHTLIEIQTSNFSSIKSKIIDLASRYPLRLVYPIAQEKWIVKFHPEINSQKSRRKSPKKGQLAEIFNELVTFPEIFQKRKFSLEVLMIQEEEIRHFVGKRRWRSRGWATVDRKLMKVLEAHHFQGSDSLLQLIPKCLPVKFTTKEIAKEMSVSPRLAQRVAYCFRKTGDFELVGKKGRSNLYRLSVTKETN